MVRRWLLCAALDFGPACIVLSCSMIALRFALGF